MQRRIDWRGMCVPLYQRQVGKTALILAVENNHVAAAEVLLGPTKDAGAIDVQACNGQGGVPTWSALMYASYMGLVVVVEKLLALGANPSLKTSYGMPLGPVGGRPGQEEKSALDWAKEKGHAGCVAELQRHVDQVVGHQPTGALGASGPILPARPTLLPTRPTRP